MPVGLLESTVMYMPSTDDYDVEDINVMVLYFNYIFL